MGSTRRAFTEEYKAQAVAFVIDGGRSAAEVARNIGVHEMMLGKWMRGHGRVARACLAVSNNAMGSTIRPSAVS